MKNSLKKQLGYYAPEITVGFLISIACIIGLTGWGVIEVILWGLSFITITIG